MNIMQANKMLNRLVTNCCYLNNYLCAETKNK